jgi:hypothetical protein
MRSFIEGGVVYRLREETGDLYRGLHLVESNVPSVSAARDRIRAAALSEDIKICVEPYTEEVSLQQVILALRESKEFKATSTICEQLHRLAESKIFFPSRTLIELRLRGGPSAEFALRDGSVVTLSRQLAEKLCESIDQNSAETILAMTENTDAFIHHTRTILEDNGNTEHPSQDSN